MIRSRPKILFVCIGNACRSQMAEGWARHLSGGRAEVFSAGSHPAGFVSPQAIRVMKESGLDIGAQKSKGLRQIPEERYDAVVTMGCGDACPHIPAARRFDWRIPDPMGSDDAVFRRTRDEIERQVRALLRGIFPEP